MSVLSELFKSVSEPNLTKSELEDYHTRLSALYAQIHEEYGSLEKAEAIYFLESKETNPELADIAIKRKWNGTEKGLRLIEIRHLSKGTEKLLSSLKNRMYSTY